MAIRKIREPEFNLRILPLTTPKCLYLENLLLTMLYSCHFSRNTLTGTDLS